LEKHIAFVFRAEEEAVPAVCLLYLLFFLEDGVTTVVGAVVPAHTGSCPQNDILHNHCLEVLKTHIV
jgi:hypothetical protein